MQIIYLAPQPPTPCDSGLRLRICALWEGLKKYAEVQLIVMTSRPNDEIGQPQDAMISRLKSLSGTRCLAARVAALFRGNHIRAACIDMEEMERLLDRLRTETPDLVVVGESFLAELVPAIKALGIPVVLDNHNVELRQRRSIAAATHNPLRRLLYTLLAKNAQTALLRHAAAADALWTVSENDGTTLRRLLPGTQPIHTVPNVIDPERYRDPGIEEQAGAVVYSGSFDYWPNAEAAKSLITYFSRLQERIEGCSLWLVGHSPTSYMRQAVQSNSAITVTDRVPSVVPYLSRAQVFAAPITAGSGTKLKLLEAMALARPIVTTSRGIEGLAVRDGHELIVADSETAFVAALEMLLNDRPRAREIGLTGQAWFALHGTPKSVETALKSALRPFFPVAADAP